MLMSTCLFGSVYNSCLQGQGEGQFASVTTYAESTIPYFLFLYYSFLYDFDRLRLTNKVKVVKAYGQSRK